MLSLPYDHEFVVSNVVAQSLGVGIGLSPLQPLAVAEGNLAMPQAPPPVVVLWSGRVPRFLNILVCFC